MFFQEYVDKGGAAPDEKTSTKLRERMENMVKELTKAHKEREQQLSMSAQHSIASRAKMMSQYKQLLVHYRWLVR